MNIDVRGEPPLAEDFMLEEKSHRRNLSIMALLVIAILASFILTHGHLRAFSFLMLFLVGLATAVVIESNQKQLRKVTGAECANLLHWRTASPVVNTYISAVNSQKRELYHVEYLYLEQAFNQEKEALDKQALYSH